MVNLNLQQRQILLTEISKCELLVSETDQKQYSLMIFFKERLVSLIKRLVQDELVFLLYRVGNQDALRERVVECTNVLK